MAGARRVAGSASGREAGWDPFEVASSPRSSQTMCHMRLREGALCRNCTSTVPTPSLPSCVLARASGARASRSCSPRSSPTTRDAHGPRVGSTAWQARGATHGRPWTTRPRASGARGRLGRCLLRTLPVATVRRCLYGRLRAPPRSPADSRHDDRRQRPDDRVDRPKPRPRSGERRSSGVRAGAGAHGGVVAGRLRAPFVHSTERSTRGGIARGIGDEHVPMPHLVPWHGTPRSAGRVRGYPGIIGATAKRSEGGCFVVDRGA